MTPCSVIFDLDGTLLDSAPDIHAALNRLLGVEGHAALDLATVTGFIGNGVPALIERTMGRVGADPVRSAEWETRFLADYAGHPHDLARPYPGVEGALRHLAAAGHPIGLCTNKPEVPARALLAAFGWAPLFGAVIGGDSLPQRKPHPAPLRAAAAALGDTRAIFVGDSEIDSETAKAAAVPFLLFTRGYRRTAADLIPAAGRFDAFADLPDLVMRYG